MVRWLNEVSKSNTEEVGEKAALLGEMIKFGFPVPRGFVISYDEFDKAMVELGPEIQSILSIAVYILFKAVCKSLPVPVIDKTLPPMAHNSVSFNSVPA